MKWEENNKPRGSVDNSKKRQENFNNFFKLNSEEKDGEARDIALMKIRDILMQFDNGFESEYLLSEG